MIINQQTDSEKIRSLAALAAVKRVRCEERSPGHFQLSDGEHPMVNYYPDSKRSTAYVCGARRGISNITPGQACDLALGIEV